MKCTIIPHMASWLLVATFATPTNAEKISFPDGLQVDIVKSGFTASLDYERMLPKESGEGWVKYSHSHSAETTHYRAMISFCGVRESSKLQKATWATKANIPALMLLVKATLPDGNALIHDSVHMHGEMLDFERKNGTIQKLSSHWSAAWRIEEQPLHFQVSDGTEGWRDMDGPVVFDAEDGHAVVSTHVFPRKVAQLRFRVLRKGQPPQFFSIQNPAHKAEVPILKASSRPCEMKMEDGIYKLSEFGIKSGSAGQSFRPSLSFDHDLQFNVLKTRTAVYDSQGNYYPAGRLRDPIWPLTGEHLFRVVMRVERSKEHYPWKLGHAALIADGRAGAAAGVLPTAEINADGKKMGFETIRFQDPPKGEKSLHHELPWNFSFMLEGKGRTREDIEGIILCIFPKAGGRQKEIHGPLCGTSSLNLPLGFKTVQNFDLKCDWLGDLAPGEEFSVGIITEPFEEAEFVIDLDAAMKFDFR